MGRTESRMMRIWLPIAEGFSHEKNAPVGGRRQQILPKRLSAGPLINTRPVPFSSPIGIFLVAALLSVLLQPTCYGWQSSSTILCEGCRGRTKWSSRLLNCNENGRSQDFLSLSSCEGGEEGQQTNEQSVIWQQLLDDFQGDFDNYNQVLDDRRLGLLPREGGGHENFHCTLIPVSETGRLAAFYFDGNPQRIFRFRYYELLLPPALSSEEESFDDYDENVDGIVMKLYTLRPQLEGLLRQHSEEPLKWPQLFASFGEGSPLEDKIDYLPNCEITWSLEMDPIQHSYVTTAPNTDNQQKETSSNSNDGLHAVMVHGEAIVDSTLIPGIKIRILDQLSLYEDVFYINDRGLDPDTGAYIYGNQKGVPYRLERVARLVDGERDLVNENLQWTLGSAWRDEDDYQARIDAIGGPSVQMRAPPPPSTTKVE